MKRFLIFLTVGAALLSACAKNEVKTADTRHEITFLTANRLTKAGIEGTVFPTTETFGAYAWTAASENPYFMDNEVISFQDPLWKASTTYYWPKNATIDFFCFYPTGLSTNLTPGETQVVISGYDVAAGQTDVMYADKAVGFSDNVDLVSDAVNGYTGVPVIFRHALAKLNFNILFPYNEKTEADGTHTEWTATVKSVALEGLYKSGGCTLNLSDLTATGVVAWNKPADANGYFVWTNDGTTARYDNTTATDLSTAAAFNPLPELFVLPQALADGQQKVTLDLCIKTKRNGADFLTENFSKTVNLLIPGSLEAWQMNQVITYNIIVNATASNGNGGNPYDPSDPSDPNRPDPDDPNLDDAVITFDPAVDGWDTITVTGNITL